MNTQEINRYLRNIIDTMNEGIDAGIRTRDALEFWEPLLKHCRTGSSTAPVGDLRSVAAQARALLRDNTESLGLGGVTRIFRRDATKLGPVAPLEPFTLAFLDPPYGKGLAEKALASAREGGWLKPAALVVMLAVPFSAIGAIWLFFSR